MPASARRRVAPQQSDSEEEARPARRRRGAPVSDDSEDDAAGSEGGEDHGEGNGNQVAPTDPAVKNLIRYALSCEYQRLPITRQGIRGKVMVAGGLPWKQVFSAAQGELRSVFGMELVELPVKEDTTLKGRLKEAKRATQSTKTSNAWMLSSILAPEYRTPEILPPSIVGSTFEEASYTGIVTMIVSIIALSSGGSIVDRALDKCLERLHANINMPMDTKVAVLKKMEKQGYIVKHVESSGGDEVVVEYRVGPRGKIEIGPEAIRQFVRTVYGEDAPDDLDFRLEKGLGLAAAQGSTSRIAASIVEDADGDVEMQSRSEAGPSRRQRRRRGGDESE